MPRPDARPGRGAPENRTPDRFNLQIREADGDWLDDRDVLDGDRPVKAVRLLSENLVLYRTNSGYGLMQRHCPHRGADLAFGRIEADGLRCSFHGWKFDGRGQCVETPAEPEGSRLCEHIRSVAYPVVEKSGILFAYLGEGEAPAFPKFDCFVAPDAYTFAFRGYWDCDWLQALDA